MDRVKRNTASEYLPRSPDLTPMDYLLPLGRYERHCEWQNAKELLQHLKENYKCFNVIHLRTVNIVCQFWISQMNWMNRC